MKYLRKAASLIISILIILSVFGGIAAADPNAAEIEFIENIIPITKISDDEADETEKKQTLFEKIKAGILRMLHPSSLKEARNNVAEGGIRQLLRPSPLSGMPNWVASPDYGALTVVEITTEQELLDNILNALGTREVVSGNRVNKTTFLLTDNFTVNASELSNTYFSAFTGPNTATLFSNIDGNGKTITIVVDTPNPARPLLNRVNDFNNINMGDRLFVRDLTVRYIGDVKTSPFANGDILFCDLENITIVVEGDIVGDYRLWEQPGVWGQTARTFGFADHISTLSDEPLIMRNISITAQTIGYVQGKTPENASNGEWLGVVNGFATNTPVQTTLENITVNYARMDGTTTSGHIEVSGFAWRINGAADNIRVNIGEIYIRPSNSVNPDGTTTVRGLGDSTYISNSTFNVSGNITMEHLEVASPSAVVGNILFYGLGELRLQSNSAYFYNNSINIAGNLTAEGPSATWIAGLMDYQQSWNTANNAVAINNSVTVGGNMESRSVRKIPTNTYFGSSQSIVVGMYAGISESVNNTLTVGGNMTSYCAGGNSFLFGHSRGLTNLRSNIQGSTTDIGGIMSSVTVSGAPTLMGINSGNLNNHDRNRLIVRNVFGAPDAMYAETQNSSASVNLQGYGMTPTAGMPVSSVTNNSVIINGNMTV
ncbi:MAG: hypothetical protein LBE57_01555, partial [Methanosarcinales archaeon]|nr:hypothetical protein [Methanosarcinales archaeon]